MPPAGLYRHGRGGAAVGLFGDRTRLELDLETPVVVAGEAVRARVRVGEPDKRAQGGRVELLYRNTFQYDDTDSDGDRTTCTTTQDVVVATCGLGHDGVLRPGELQVALPLPREAPGTSARSVEWLLRAVVDRRRAGDAEAVAPVTVRVPPQPLADWAQTPPASPAGWAVAFTLRSRVVRPGEDVTGTVVLTPAQDLRARGLRVRLRRERLDQDGNSTGATADETVVAEDLQLPAGRPASYAFSLAVPPDAPPSFVAAHNEQHWYLDAVVDRARALDAEARLEIVVHTA